MFESVGKKTVLLNLAKSLFPAKKVCVGLRHPTNIETFWRRGGFTCQRGLLEMKLEYEFYVEKLLKKTQIKSHVEHSDFSEETGKQVYPVPAVSFPVFR